MNHLRGSDLQVSYEVIPTDYFEAELKHYKKKYRSVTKDIRGVLEEIKSGNLVGDEIPNLNLVDGEHVFKVRAANASSQKGKSGGFRIIYYVIQDDKVVWLLSLYSKAEQENIEKSEIHSLIRKYCYNDTD